MVNSLGGPIGGWDGVLGGFQGGINSISQIDGDSDMASACGLCEGRAHKRDSGLCLSVWEKAVPHLLS